MKQAIVDYHQDEESHWVARLACGHFQHVRHQPPFICRPWVINKETRVAMLGQRLNCIKCDKGIEADFDTS